MRTANSHALQSLLNSALLLRRFLTLDVLSLPPTHDFIALYLTQIVTLAMRCQSCGIFAPTNWLPMFVVIDGRWSWKWHAAAAAAAAADRSQFIMANADEREKKQKVRTS